MGTDARGHKVPLGIDTPRRAWFNDLSLSVNDVIPVASTAEASARLAQLLAVGIPTDGTVWWIKDRDAMYVRTKNQWARVIDETDSLLPVAAYGTVTNITGSSNQVRKRVVTFPVGRFPRTPVCMIQMGTGTTTASTTHTEMWVSNRTAASFQANVNRSNTTTVGIQWMAMYYGGAPEVPDFPDAEAGLLMAMTRTVGEDGSGPTMDAFDVADATAGALDVSEQAGLETATCHTVACMNSGVGIPVLRDQEQVAPVVCGACGKPVTDLAA